MGLTFSGFFVNFILGKYAALLSAMAERKG
jgi:hypothetical protein